MYPAQSSKRKKSPYFSEFIEKALIENKSKSSNIPINRRKKLTGRNDNHSFSDVHYLSFKLGHAVAYFDSKNITGIDNRSDDTSLNKSNDANKLFSIGYI